MAVIDQVRSEISASITTLMRRHGSSADEAEKAAIVQAISDLNDELTLLNQAALLQTANSLSSATTILERAVGAARLGPFDGYLAALEGHLNRINVLSGKVHSTDSLESAAKGGRAAKPPKGAPGSTLEAFAPAFLTSTVFEDLRDEYQDCFGRCTLRQEFAGNVAYYVKRLRQGQPNYQLVEKQIGVPWVFVGIIHGMECGFNFAAHLHNGDKLSARTVQVPKGRPLTGQPPFTWLDSALDALRLRKLDKVTDWSVPHMLYQLEGYNGFGYRRRAVPTPYLWSFSNIYDKGKFVADGRFDPEAISKQCGAALMMKAVQNG